MLNTRLVSGVSFCPYSCPTNPLLLLSLPVRNSLEGKRRRAIQPLERSRFKVGLDWIRNQVYSRFLSQLVLKFIRECLHLARFSVIETAAVVSPVFCLHSASVIYLMLPSFSVHA